MIITVNPEKTDSDFKEIYNMILEEIESKDSLKEQVDFISMMIRYLNGKIYN